ncbi:MAG: hypothetical protein AB1428_04270 [Bacteroidota bacterium]
MSRHSHIQPPTGRRSQSVLLAFFLLTAPAAAQQGSSPSLPSAATTIAVTPGLLDSLIRLPDQFIVAETDTVLIDTHAVARRGTDYSIGYRFGTVRFDTVFLQRLLQDSTGRAHTVTVRYMYFPFRLRGVYARRTLVTLRDTTGRDSVAITRARSALTVDDIFGPNLQKSGSIVRGFTVGSNRDLSLNSGFRMQLAGKIASDIDVAATLTDENTPIQPEGTTQTLQEFDKVFVEIRSTDVGATLGDFVLDMDGQEFARLSRKLQGAKGNADYRFGSTSGSAIVAGAITRGKFSTMQFPGLEGVQGPYRLTGRNSERDIIVIAGTERVYINGEAMTRGETNDYTIDYSTAEVTFTPRRLITSASRIVIDFEYTDRQYSRSLIGVKSSTAFFDEKARFTFSYLREADDPDAPIDFAVTDSARRVLEQAGGDRSKAVVSGVTRADTGGVYVQVDSLLAGGVPVRFYRYAPGDPNAKYLVSFSFVGAGRGDYVRRQVGVFEWRGAGGGDYLPLRYLPLPQSDQILDFALDLRPVKELTVSGEYAGSTFNANRFSSLPGTSIRGEAIRFTAGYSPRDIMIGGTDIGGFDLLLKERRVGARFVPIDRTNDIEFNRKWGVDSLAAADEEIREGTLRYMPSNDITVGGTYGRITRGDAQRSTRVAGTVSMRGPVLPVTDYEIERVRTTDRPGDNAGVWLRQKGSIAHTIGLFTPGFAYEGERREITPIAGTGFKQGSFAYDMYGPRLSLRELGPLSLSAEFSWRNDNQTIGGALLRESNSFTQAYASRLAERGNFSTSLYITLRKKLFTPEFRLLGNSDIQTVLVRSQSRYTPLNRGVEADLFYETATQRSSRPERVFVRVAQGSGNYRYLGDLNNNGIADENEFVLTRFDGDFIVTTVPTEELFPIIDLNSSLRVRVTPSRFIDRDGGFLSSVLRPVSTETYIRIDEKSSERDLKQIYLLNFNRFLRDSTTLAGSQVLTQDLLMFEGEPTFSARFRYSQRRGLTNFSGGIEHAYTRERSVRLRWQLVPDIANQLDFVNRIDRVTSLQQSARLRDILSNAVTFDVSYRPEQNVELGMKFDLGEATDRLPVPTVDAALNAQTVRFVYAFLGAGQARAEASREEVRVSRTLELYPYELTGGRVAGKTWQWRAGFDYRVTQFIQATVAYDGRTEAGAAPVHTARAEVRAFF